MTRSTREFTKNEFLKTEYKHSSFIINYAVDSESTVQ